MHSLLCQLFSENLINMVLTVLQENVTEDCDLIVVSEKFPGGRAKKSWEMESENAHEQGSITTKPRKEAQHSLVRQWAGREGAVARDPSFHTTSHCSLSWDSVIHKYCNIWLLHLYWPLWFTGDNASLLEITLVKYLNIWASQHPVLTFQ